ncbi:putative LRR receptor-like serine/threonine-protein kinase [Dorcoceras hygrometricum]|uniref:Putative LRR receptor-like serine/threonine-protein kinase n=1 Tax=Dorcoceras hygrometricum TaxID=472368 RepID=A0A2Z7CFD0_9LAMI|nr:putative LRR receptor-like serine/threonine-protein kinase [Dorcoceras hygrometricum]
MQTPAVACGKLLLLVSHYDARDTEKEKDTTKGYSANSPPLLLSVLPPPPQLRCDHPGEEVLLVKYSLGFKCIPMKELETGRVLTVLELLNFNSSAAPGSGIRIRRCANRLITVKHLRVHPLKPRHNQLHVVHTGCQLIYLILDLSGTSTTRNTTLILIVLTFVLFLKLPSTSTPTSRRHRLRH